MKNDAVSSKNLEGFFNTKSVAVIGASANPSKIGYQILNNVIAGGFEGEIYPINPKDDEILGKKAYKSVSDVPGDIDLAVITIPAPFVVATMEECAKKKVKNVAIITSGFAEVGNHEDEEKIKKIADENNMAFIGPNILGFLYTPLKLNASFGPQDILSGKIAFVSQSGALAIALMGWTVMESIGLGSLVSLGNKADVDERDLIEHFNSDGNIDVVLIYMEGLKDGRKFLNTEIKKPVIILKVGRSQRGAKAAASHTGSLAGADGIFDAAFKQMGALRANSFTDAFGWARAFALPIPQGEETIVITNGGGIGVSTTDACEEAGIQLLEDVEWTEEKFRKTMPDFGSTKNPIDITGGAGVEGYRKAIKISLEEDKIHCVIVLYCETAVTDPLDIAKAVAEEYRTVERNKPIVAAFVGGERSRSALHFLSQNNIPAYDSVDQAVSALKILHTWKDICNRPKDVPEEEKAPQEVVDMIDKIKKEGRSLLLEHEAREIMEKCGVPTPKWAFATTVEEAIEKAEGMYPLAIKIASLDIVHKTDVGGVALNISDEEELRVKFNSMMINIPKKVPNAKLLGINMIQMTKGIECIIGMSVDPQFGPVVMFGLGGVFVELMKDVSFRVVPFGKIEAERLIGSIKGQKVLNGFRGMKAHKESIIQTLCSVQKLAPLVKEIDINPLISNDEGSFAVDARIIV
ncbi:MAG: acetate--CoA ligase family protein [Candidatus Omnitrophica bacterium]|nr:acetate--CoA ligase family protein [Candidatus Omnitrophota bacterium]MBU1995559.1 acetate--CoA ligase family protein [Candidatus Omnitrophota bacterium]